MSLVASHVSGITLLGTGTEIYLYGTQYCFIFIAIFVSAIFLHFIIIPVLHGIQVTSAYEVGDEASALNCATIIIKFLVCSTSKRDSM